MSFLSRLLGRKPPPEDRRNMNEDWRVGDLAVCLVDVWHPPKPDNPARGDVLRVSQVFDRVSENHRIRAIWLCFEGKRQTCGWTCTGFRKVRHAHRAEESEISRQIRACRPRERVGV